MYLTLSTLTFVFDGLCIDNEVRQLLGNGHLPNSPPLPGTVPAIIGHCQVDRCYLTPWPTASLRGAVTTLPVMQSGTLSSNASLTWSLALNRMQLQYSEEQKLTTLWSSAFVTPSRPRNY